RPALDVVIAGTKGAEQVVQNIEAANIQLTDDELNKIDELFPIE
ncbi:oxidoreductase, partial [Staphylococcus haemolyticus]|nr:oxidoreductase [Staphylococcus haemolyticus]